MAQAIDGAWWDAFEAEVDALRRLARGLKDEDARDDIEACCDICEDVILMRGTK